MEPLDAKSKLLDAATKAGGVLMEDVRRSCRVDLASYFKYDLYYRSALAQFVDTPCVF